MNNQVYKIFQLMEFFITKYQYVSVQIKNLVNPNEVFIVSKDNKTYPLIRISNTSVINTKYEKDRIDKIIEVLSMQFNVDKTNILDIHVCNDEVNEDVIYHTIAINSDYYSGVDVDNLYPGIKNVVYDTANEEEALKKSIYNINTAVRNLKEKAKKRPIYRKLKEAHTPVTFFAILICVVIYALSLVLQHVGGYSNSASLIAIGANYKMFTLGLNQYWRLLTGAFVHSSFIHLLFNVWSFYIVGSVIERNLGSLKMLVMLITGIIISSLTVGTLSGNSLVIGLSGGIYCLFIYLIAFYLGNGFINTRTFLPTIMLNLALNFLPGVSWQSHLGGAICGLIFYYIYKDKKFDLKIYALLVIIACALSYKYVNEYNIKPYYALTDMEALQIYYDIGLKDYAENRASKLITIYNS